MSDNAPQFTSEEFSLFMRNNGIRPIRISPYHPSSNGMAERFVQTFKQSMKASQNDGRTLQQRLADFLLSYRITPHSTTNQSPSSLLLNRIICSRLTLVHPNLETHVFNKVIKKNTTINEQKHVHLKSDKQSWPGTSGLETNDNQERLFDNWAPLPFPLKSVQG